MDVYGIEKQVIVYIKFLIITISVLTCFWKTVPIKILPGTKSTCLQEGQTRNDCIGVIDLTNIVMF